MGKISSSNWIWRRRTTACNGTSFLLSYRNLASITNGFFKWSDAGKMSGSPFLSMEGVMVSFKRIEGSGRTTSFLPQSSSLLQRSLVGASRTCSHQGIVKSSAFLNVVHRLLIYFFADDVIQFLNGRLSNVHVLQNLIHQYESSSGQWVNAAKTVFITPKKITQRKAHRLSSITGYTHSSLPITYLGVLLAKGKIRSPLLQLIVQKIINKIKGWQAKFLNQVAKLTLIKHVLSNIPVYLLSAINIPKSVCKTLNRALANFVWGSSKEGHKRHWINWMKICAPTQEGGLGIRLFEDVMQAYRVKMCWNLLESKSIWATFFSSKYFWNFIFRKGIASSVSSSVWKEMLKALPFALSHSRWLIGAGRISFWVHNWSGCGLLATAIVRPVPPHLLSATVNDFNPLFRRWCLTDI
ncbi:uncharacterized protein LOC131239113 [Magnolia sinica]|uniref:uncharacterized protein LOC131239113 n=1 Tax=Magnolia sinica TaxID=86752 RepID=UPI00265993A5|nr:uncharacterized protein LOC131239113 [Magnolia sinica]